MLKFSKIATLVFIGLAGIVTILVGGCTANEKGPSEAVLADRIEAHISKSLDANVDVFFDVKNVIITESENIGTKVEPIVIGRYSSEPTLLESIYTLVSDQKLQNVKYTTRLLKTEQSFEKGHHSVATGTFKANVDRVDSSGNKIWEISITDFVVVKDRWSGYPLDDYGELWSGQTEIGNPKPFIVTPDKFKTADELIKSQVATFEQAQAAKRQEYLRVKRAWLDSLTGTWYSSKVYKYKSLTARNSCRDFLKLPRKTQIITELTIEFPRGIQDQTDTPVIGKISSPQIPGSLKEVPMILHTYYEKNKNAFVRNPKSIALRLGDRSENFIACPGSTSRFRNIGVLVDYKGPVINNSFELKREKRTGSSGTLKKIK